MGAYYILIDGTELFSEMPSLIDYRPSYTTCTLDFTALKVLSYRLSIIHYICTYLSIFPSIRLPSLVSGRNHRMRRHLLPEGTVSAS